MNNSRTHHGFASIVAVLIALSAFSVSAQVRVTAVDEEISTMTETPAGDALLEGSHVLVAPADGQGKFFSTIGMAGGAIGALLGTTIDRARAESAAKEGAGSAIDALKLKWFNEMNAAIEKVATQSPDRYKVTRGTAEDPGVKLRVFARLSPARTQGQYAAALGVKTRFKSADDKEIRRDYSHPLHPSRAIAGDGGWTAAGPSSLRESSAIAIDRLAKLIARDVNGELQSLVMADTLPVITLSLPGNDQPIKYFLVEETEDTFLVVPNVRDRPARFFWVLLDKAHAKRAL